MVFFFHDNLSGFGSKPNLSLSLSGFCTFCVSFVGLAFLNADIFVDFLIDIKHITVDQTLFILRDTFIKYFPVKSTANKSGDSTCLN